MGFHYTRPPLTQHLLQGTLLALSVAALLSGALAAPWRALVDGLPDLALVVLGPWLIHQAVFWAVVLAFHRVDRTDRPAWIARHRIQVDHRRHPPFARAARRVLVNQVVWAPLMLLAMWGLLAARGWAPSATLPSPGQLVLELAALAGAALVVFYVAHRFLHRPWWMKRVHKLHHEFTTTTAIASEYAHPVEFCVGNFGTLAAGVVLFAPSLLAIYLFTLMAMLNILVHHSGYALPWAPWSVHHDWHHYRSREAFGAQGLMDRLLHTDRELRTLEHGDRR